MNLPRSSSRTIAKRELAPRAGAHIMQQAAGVREEPAMGLISITSCSMCSMPVTQFDVGISQLRARRLESMAHGAGDPFHEFITKGVITFGRVA